MAEEIKINGNSIQIGNKVCYCVDKDLIDYITNIQQLYENALKINQNSHKYITELEDKYVVLQQENERLKEDLDKANDIIQKDRQFYKCRMDEYVELKKENEILRKNAEHNDKVVDKVRWNEMIYKSRNEKAIECIEKNQERKTYYGGICDGEDYYILYNSDEVLNILNGSDEK